MRASLFSPLFSLDWMSNAEFLEVDGR